MAPASPTSGSWACSRPGNVLIASDARLVDWAWPTRAAPWIDPACWIVWLIASGHNPADAETSAASVPAQPGG